LAIVLGTPLFPSYGIATIDDPVDQVSHGRMQHHLTVITGIVGMSRRSISEDADDFTFGNYLAIVERQQKRFADGECRRGRYF